MRGGRKRQFEQRRRGEKTRFQELCSYSDILTFAVIFHGWVGIYY